MPQKVNIILSKTIESINLFFSLLLFSLCPAHYLKDRIKTHTSAEYTEKIVERREAQIVFTDTASAPTTSRKSGSFELDLLAPSVKI